MSDYATKSFDWLGLEFLPHSSHFQYGRSLFQSAVHIECGPGGNHSITTDLPAFRVADDVDVQEGPDFGKVMWWSRVSAVHHHRHNGMEKLASA